MKWLKLTSAIATGISAGLLATVGVLAVFAANEQAKAYATFAELWSNDEG